MARARVLANAKVSCRNVEPCRSVSFVFCVVGKDSLPQKNRHRCASIRSAVVPRSVVVSFVSHRSARSICTVAAGAKKPYVMIVRSVLCGTGVYGLKFISAVPGRSYVRGSKRGVLRCRISRINDGWVFVAASLSASCGARWRTAQSPSRFVPRLARPRVLTPLR